MLPVSIVIITRNEEKNIIDCINSARSLSSDIIVVDCGSNDQTVELAREFGARVIDVDWVCYGHSRNTGADAARHDWIIALDADERITPLLAKRIRSMKLHPGKVYRFKRINHFGNKIMKYGVLGHDKPVRMYNRKNGRWNMNLVHEKLETSASPVLIKEPFLHYSVLSAAHFSEKMEHYAGLTARSYLLQNKSATLLKRFVSPLFNAVKSYIFQLGFMDGKEGWIIARIVARYTWLKYDKLHRMTITPIAGPKYTPVFAEPSTQEA